VADLAARQIGRQRLALGNFALACRLVLGLEFLDFVGDSLQVRVERLLGSFGAARPHHAYLFANRRANRLKVLVHDGIGVWLAARRLNQGRFVWTSDGAPSVGLTREQFDALVLGLPWQRIGEAGVISVL
jgi:transposase